MNADINANNSFVIITIKSSSIKKNNVNKTFFIGFVVRFFLDRSKLVKKFENIQKSKTSSK